MSSIRPISDLIQNERISNSSVDLEIIGFDRPDRNSDMTTIIEMGVQKTQDLVEIPNNVRQMSTDKNGRTCPKNDITSKTR